MKYQQHNIRSYTLGILTTLMVFSLASPALAAASKLIEVSGGVKIFIDDMELRPTDANGNPIEAFIYNGTTYLPVRAVSEGLGKPVQWDGSTRSVYIGKHSSSEPTAWLADMDYFAGTQNITQKTVEMDNSNNSHYHCIVKSFDRTYKINGQYSRMTGTMYQSYDMRSFTIRKDSGVEIYGDGRLLYTNIITEGITGFELVNFDIDLTGVLELQVKFTVRSNSGNHGGEGISLGDVGLWA